MSFRRISLALLLSTPSFLFAADLKTASGQADEFATRLLAGDVSLEESSRFNTVKQAVAPTVVVLNQRALWSGSRYAYHWWDSFKVGVFIEHCTASNDRYRFTLSRKASKPDREWVLRGIQDSVTPSEPKDPYSVASEDCRGYIRNQTGAHLLREFCPLSRLESLPGYAALPATGAAAPGRQVFEFGYDVVPRGSSAARRSTVRVEVDPSFHSLPCAVKEVLESPAGRETWTWTREWVRQDREGYVITEKGRYDFEATVKRDTYFYETDTRIAVSLSSLKESAFRLPAFGLPEPAGFEPKPTPLYVWLLSGAGVCLLLFFLFRRLAARRATA